MFTTTNVPCQIDGIVHKKVKLRNHEPFVATILTLRVDSLTHAIAGEIPGVKSAIFKRSDGTTIDEVASVKFTYRSKSQRLELRADPSMEPSLVIGEAVCDDFQIPKRGKGDGPVLKFRVTLIDEPIGNDLLYLKHALFEQRYFTFERSAPGLLDELDATERRESREAKPVRTFGRARDEDDMPTAV